MASEGVEVGAGYVTVLPSAKGFGAALRAAITAPAAEAGQQAARTISEALASIRPAPISSRVSVDTGSAAASGAVAGDSAAAHFSERFNEEIGVNSRAGFARLADLAASIKVPDLRPNLDVTTAEGKLAELQRQLTALKAVDVRPTIDVLDAEGITRVLQFQARLDQLAATIANPKVQVDTSALNAAQVEMAKVYAQLQSIGNIKVNVPAPHIDTTWNALIAEARSQGEKAGKETSNGFSQGIAYNLSVAGAGFAIGNALYSGLSTALHGAEQAIFGFNSQLQNADIAFTTMLGSGEQAEAFLAHLKSFAASTPFEFPDLVTASQRLLAMGISAHDVIPDLTGIGDAVAGLGGSKELINQVTLAIGQMASKGKVQGDELLQLTGAGIPALKILAAEYGVSTANMQAMISAGKIASDEAIPKLIDGLEHGTSATASFGGMMDKQSRTFTGALSNIADSTQQGLANTFLPLFDRSSTAVQGLATAMSSTGFQGGLHAVGDGLATTLSTAGRLAREVGTDLGPAFDLTASAIGHVLAILEPLGPVAATVLGGILVGGLRAVGAVITPVASGVEGLTHFLQDNELATIGLATAITVALLPSMGRMAASFADAAIFEGGLKLVQIKNTVVDLATALISSPWGLAATAIGVVALSVAGISVALDKGKKDASDWADAQVKAAFAATNTYRQLTEQIIRQAGEQVRLSQVTDRSVTDFLNLAEAGKLTAASYTRLQQDQSAAAQEALKHREQADALQASYKKVVDIFGQASAATGLNADQLQQLGFTYDDLKGKTSDAVNKLIGEATAAQHAADPNAVLGDAIKEVGSKSVTTAKQTGDLQSALLALVDPSYAAVKAQIDYRAQLAQLPQDIDAVSRSLQGNSDGALKNQAAFMKMIEAGDAQIVTMQTAGMANGDLSSAIAGVRSDLLKQAHDLHFNAGEAQGLIDKYLHMPPDVTTAIKQPGMPEAQQNTRTLQDYLQGINGTFEPTIKTPGMLDAQQNTRTLQDYLQGLSGTYDAAIQQPGMEEALQGTDDLTALLKAVPGITPTAITQPGMPEAQQNTTTLHGSLQAITGIFTATVNADTSQAEYALRVLRADLSGLDTAAQQIYINAANNSASATGRASGGPVEAGHLYKVNEVGTEMFVPAQNGTIIPHSQAASWLGQMDGAGASGQPGKTYNQNFYYSSRALTGDEVVRAQDQHDALHPAW